MKAYDLLTTPHDRHTLEGGVVVSLTHSWQLTTRESWLFDRAVKDNDLLGAVAFCVLPNDYESLAGASHESLVRLVAAWLSPRPGREEPSAKPAPEVSAEELDFAALSCRLTKAYGFAPPEGWENVPRYRLNWYVDNVEFVRADQKLHDFEVASAAQADRKGRQSVLNSWRKLLRKPAERKPLQFEPVEVTK